ncbi:hypothetical protein JCM6882_000109 [Rhodosporidiobolus microsporus]
MSTSRPASSQSQSRSRASSLSRSQSSRPTTPLRRLSSSSLRAASLSHSASRAPGAHTSSAAPPLAHLAPVFAELADAVSDLTANFEELERANERLSGVNEAFAGWLYGLRANGYTVDFLEAPTKLNFSLATERSEARFLADQAARQAAALAAAQQHHQSHGDDSPPGSPSRSGAQHHGGLGETTFVTNDDESFLSNGDETPAPRGGVRGGRGGGGSGIGRGGAPSASSRGGAPRGRGGKPASAGGGGGPVGKRRKEEMAAFADPVLPLLPISLRENRRMECEKVLWALKERPAGASMADLLSALSTATPASQSVPQVRINEVLLALVRAKVVVKGAVKGAAQYHLDPNKYPS